jgi:ABC-2 type transport system ATP-binding protein
VFIERGKLLRAGTLDQLLADEVQHRTVIVRPLGLLEEVHKHLLVQPSVEAVRVVDNCLEADVAGTEEVCCEVLTSLVQSGFKILEFRPQRADLEQIFMNVTKGDVA